MRQPTRLRMRLLTRQYTQLADSACCPLDTFAVGILKGGGPGGGQDAPRVGDMELGLSKAYYDGIAELETYMTTQAHDRFTLGATVLAGDPLDLPSALMRIGRRGSFDPRDDETSRIVGAAAAVHAIRHPSTVELSIGAAKGEAPPTTAQWQALFEHATTPSST